jgi:L-lactate permease
VLGKMISPQNLAIAAAAVGMAGKEGDIFRKVIGWSLVLLALMCVIVGCSRRRCWTGWCRRADGPGRAAGV